MAIKSFVHLADISQALRRNETDLLEYKFHEKLSFSFIPFR
jgi:hypothetical protein